MVLNRRIPLLVILSCCFSVAHASESPASSTLHRSSANSFNLSRQNHVGDARSQVSSSSPLATNHNILIGPHSTLPRRSALCFASHQCTIKNGIHSHRLNPRQIHNFVAIPQNPLVKQREVGPFCGDAGLSVSTSSNDIGSGKKRNNRSNKSDTKSKNDINYVAGNPGKRKRMRKSEIDDLVRGIGLVPVQSTKKKRKKNNTTKQTKTIDEHNRDMKLEINNLEENTNMD